MDESDSQSERNNREIKQKKASNKKKGILEKK